MAPGVCARSTRRWAVRRNAEAALPRLAPSSTKRNKGTSAPSGQSETGKPRGELTRENAKRIDTLNPALKSEMSAINQYWPRYRILDNWGYKERAKIWREESIEEMRHADTLTARILFLEGYLNMQSINPLRIGQGVQQIVGCDLAARTRPGRFTSTRRSTVSP